MDRPEPALARLIDRVMLARANRVAVEIRGGGTKHFYGGAPTGEPLPVAGLAGISSYEPTELVVTVRAGTPLAELEAALEERGQCLPFEPPRFAPGGTVGGMVAAGLSGPAPRMTWTRRWTRRFATGWSWARAWCRAAATFRRRPMEIFGRPGGSTLRQTMVALGEAGLRVEYLELRDAATLAPLADTPTRPARLLAAVHLGRTRLIDNIAVASS